MFKEHPFESIERTLFTSGERPAAFQLPELKESEFTVRIGRFIHGKGQFVFFEGHHTGN